MKKHTFFSLLVAMIMVALFQGQSFSQSETEENLRIQKANEIREAIKNEDVATVKRLIESGADVNAKYYLSETAPFLSDWTLLHEAVAKCADIEISRFLIENGAEVNASAWYETDQYETISYLPMTVADTEEKRELLRSYGGYWESLFAAVEKNDLVALKNQTEANFSIRNEKEQTLLDFAAEKVTDTAILEYLIDEKKLELNPEIVRHSSTPRTPLHTAAAHNPNLDILKYLIEKGGDTTTHLWVPSLLAYATCNQNTEIPQYLIETYHFDVNAKGDSGETAIFYAARESNAAMIRLLVDQYHADVNHVNNNEFTPLHIAAMLNHSEVVKALVECGANVNALTGSKETPLSFWVFHGILEPDYHETVKWLVEHGADVHAGNDNILYHAVFTKYVAGHLRPDRWETIKYLLEQGANPHASSGDVLALGIFVAEIDREQLDRISFWLNHGVDINVRDRLGRNPAFYLNHKISKIESYTATMQVLLDLGLDINAVNNDGESVLADVIRHGGRFDIIKFLIEHGANINDTTKEGETILHIRLSEFTREQLRYLVEEKKINIHAKTTDGVMPIHVAASYYGNREMLEYLLELGVDPNVRDNQGRTALDHAILSKTDSAVKILLEHSAKWDTKDDKGLLAIQNAAIARDLKTLNSLVQAGADVKVKSNDGKNLLHFAVMKVSNHYDPLVNHIDTEMVEALVEQYGIDVNEKDDKGHTPLHLLADYEKMTWPASKNSLNQWAKTIDYLLEHGADINAGTNLGATPLHKIAAYSPNVFHAMVERGADLMARDNQGAVPFHRMVAHTWDDTLMSKIMALGYDINIQDNRGHTPLHYAIIQGGNDWIVRFFFENGADVHVVDTDGKTLLHFAANHEQTHYGLYALKHLIAQGLDVNAQDNEGNTPLHEAASWGNRDYSAMAVEYLLQHGADPLLKNHQNKTPADCVQGSTQEQKLVLLRKK